MTPPATLALRLYHACASAFGIVAPLLLAWRGRRGKEDPTRWRERRGEAGLPRPAGPLIWLHGASVGEILTLLPLAERLAGRDLAILLTSGTVTSAAVVSSRLPAGARHQFVPLDVPLYIRRFLDHWRPDIAIFAESELWPTTVLEARRRGVRLVLLNGRMSRRSFARWGLAPKTARALVASFDLITAQSLTDAGRLSVLAAGAVSAPGNLKFDAPAPPFDEAALLSLRRAIGTRPVWVAASTHPGEERLVAAAHLRLRADLPDLLTIVVPRHPERGDAIAAEFAASGLAPARRSRGVLPDAGTGAYLADTLGELGIFYRVGRIVFVGASLVERGGHNPIEPVKAGCVVLHGPYVENFQEAFERLDAAGAALSISSAEDLSGGLRRLLADPTEVERMATGGAAAVASLAGALERTMTALEPYLATLKPGSA